MSLWVTSVVGIIYKTDEGIDADQFGQRPLYSVQLCLFVEDKINGVSPGECQSYRVDFADFESTRVNDIVRGQVVPGPFRGFNIIDIQEIYSGMQFIQIMPWPTFGLDREEEGVSRRLFKISSHYGFLHTRIYTPDNICKRYGAAREALKSHDIEVNSSIASYFKMFLRPQQRISH
jgi:hypothetical protein